MKKLGIVVIALVMPWTVNAQSIDMERMDRDIEIAENILSTLSSQRSNNSFYFGNNVEGNYLEGYGVIFNLPSNDIIYRLRKNNDRSRAVISAGSDYSYSYSTNDSDVESIVLEAAPKVEIKTKEEKGNLKAKEKQDEELANNDMIDIMKIFLVDYADLIGQLKPNERIKVVSKSAHYDLWIDGEHNKKQTNGKSAEILKSDLIDYKQGKTNREDAMKKVVVTVNEANTKKEQDLEIFSGIFSRLYEPSFSQTYYSVNHRLNYERLENFGVIFNMKMYSTNSDAGLHTIRTTGESGLTQKERDEKVNAMYPEFEKSFKENLLDYGRTIRSLKPNEMLLFKVKLTECKGCDMPNSIEVSVKGSVLADYNLGKLTRDSAMKMVTIKKNN